MDNDAQRGTKRKRYEPPQEELSVRIKGKLHHEMKEVYKASKRAKTFETQKVVKKLKDLGKKGDNTQAIGEYETELACLKETDHDSIGNTALKTKLLKDRTLRENKDIMTAMNNELEGSLVVLAEPGTTVAKIQSRLLSSKFLGIQIARSLEALRVLLNPALKQNESDVHAQGPSDKGKERPSKLRKDTSTSILHSTAEAPSRLDDTNQDSNIHMEGWESGSIDGVEEPDDGWESGDIGPNDALEDEEDPVNQEESYNELNVKKQLEPSKPGKSAKSFSDEKNESTFLPSLSVGFIRGGSDDSDWSETEDKDTGLEPRKNRRGQRARRAIWEKKFGRNAHHKKKEEEAEVQAGKFYAHTSRSNKTRPNQGSSVTPGSTRHSKDKSFLDHPVDTGWDTRRVTGSLHPSWEAKRRLKEKESIGIVPSQGKKIKFS